MSKKRVLVLGISGMLGNAVMRLFSEDSNFETFGTSRSKIQDAKLISAIKNEVLYGYDLENNDHLIQVFLKTKPDYVINCVGLVKQLKESNEPLFALPLNSILPHRLEKLCALVSAKLIQISTDCVFTGKKGNYSELDVADATDIYGRSKLLGEVNTKNSVTLRTSIIGHELRGARSLVDWFLSQKGSIEGFSRAVFSGLPTCELAHVIKDVVIPNPKLSGLYHVSADPINKYELLKKISRIYDFEIEINENNNFVIDRSLNSSKFKEETGYAPPNWDLLIKKMFDFK